MDCSSYVLKVRYRFSLLQVTLKWTNLAFLGWGSSSGWDSLVECELEHAGLLWVGPTARFQLWVGPGALFSIQSSIPRQKSLETGLFGFRFSM